MQTKLIPELQQFWQNSTINFWVLATVSAIAAFHLHLVWREQISIGQSAMTISVGWAGMIYLLWQKQSLEPGAKNQQFPALELAETERADKTVPIWIRATGLFLLGWMLVRALMRRNTIEIFGIFFPLIAVTGLLLCAVGWQGRKTYRWEFLIAAFLSLPLGSIDFFADKLGVPTIDAKIATFVLHYFGFEVMRQDTKIYMPGGAVEIASACSSFSTIVSILILLLAFICVYPVPRLKQVLLIFGAIASVLVVNSLRMCLLAILVANKQEDAFVYWHGSAGSEVFSNIAIFCVAGWGYLLIKQPEIEDDDDEPET